MLIRSFPNRMHAKNYEDRSTSSEDIRSFFHMGMFLIRFRHFRSINLLIIDHVVTLEVTGRSRPDIACLIRHFERYARQKVSRSLQYIRNSSPIFQHSDFVYVSYKISDHRSRRNSGT